MQIAYNGQVLWSANAFQDGQPHMAEFRCAYTEIDQAESGVAIVGTEFGQEPGRMRILVNSLTTGSGSRFSPRAAAAPLSSSWTR